MLTRPFLTELDSRAAVKGSVDPLGIQALWTFLGRGVVGNLTTVSTSAADFTILLVGYYLAEQVSDLRGPSEAATCLKWEQLAAYSRAHLLGQTSFRGTTRTRKFLAESTHVTLSANQANQILASQKSYGIFGLYSNPARASGLLEQDRPRLTALGRDLVERFLVPMLAGAAGKNARRLVARLKDESVRVHLDGRDKRLAEAVGEVLEAHADEELRKLYRELVLFGGPNDSTGGRQRDLAIAFAETFDDDDYYVEPGRLRQLIRRASKRSQTDLAAKLEEIHTCESAMAPFATLFSFVVQRDGVTVAEVAKELRGAWGKDMPTVDAAGLERLEGELRTASRNESAASRLVHAARTLRAGEYEETLRLLMQQNAWVMKTRGGAPWVEERKGKLHVRLRYDEGRLPSRKGLPHLWRHAYFLESVRSIGCAVGVA